MGTIMSWCVCSAQRQIRMVQFEFVCQLGAYKHCTALLCSYHTVLVHAQQDRVIALSVHGFVDTKLSILRKSRTLEVFSCNYKEL